MKALPDRLTTDVTDYGDFFDLSSKRLSAVKSKKETLPRLFLKRPTHL
jgi:hypothetical protein